jgi:hypothetical protein
MSDVKVTEQLNFEGAKIIFKNFEGRETKFNKAGNRNFCIVIPDANYAQKLLADGWNVRASKPRDPDEEPLHYIPVAVGFEYLPPKVFLVTNQNGVETKSPLGEDTVSELDSADIKYVDAIIRPYNWEVNGNKGVKAYLKTMYAVLEQDPYAHKYAQEREDAPFES